ncbi:DUF2806 domain-containing protein [Fulvimarina sp. 2208YS6-2-32]|nr:DUF2806 domain-containing protein [Fulvimarina sp. 2208YS6-2-32]
MAWMPGEELLKRLWESIEKLGTGLASPAQIRREGKARADVRRYELLRDAEAMRDAQDILAGRAKLNPESKLITGPAHSQISYNADTGGMQLPNVVGRDAQLDLNNALRDTTHLSALAAQSQISANISDIERLAALRATVSMTEDVLVADAADSDKIAEKAPSEEEETINPQNAGIEPDWLSSWREGAERTTNNDLRLLWARLLAGEIKSQGSYSKRTMSFLNSIDVKEARLIEKIGPYVCDKIRILAPENTHSDASFLEKYGIQFVNLIELEELGILTGATGIGFTVPLNFSHENPMVVKLNRNRCLVAIPRDDNKTINLRAYKLSTIGAEVVSLGSFETPEAYIHELAEFFKSANMRVLIGEAKDAGLNRITLENGREL